MRGDAPLRPPVVGQRRVGQSGGNPHGRASEGVLEPLTLSRSWPTVEASLDTSCTMAYRTPVG